MIKSFALFLLVAISVEAGSLSSCIIQHDNCSHDANCGLTCDGIFQRELVNDPSFNPPSGFYEDFIENCFLFYWPSGSCPSGDGGNGNGSGFSSVDSVEAVMVMQSFNDGFMAGLLSVMPICFGVFAVLTVVFLLSHSVKAKGV